jgi:hypothetical protein
MHPLPVCALVLFCTDAPRNPHDDASRFTHAQDDTEKPRKVAHVAYDKTLSTDPTQSLRLPAAFGDAAHVTALDIDACLEQDERPRRP